MTASKLICYIELKRIRRGDTRRIALKKYSLADFERDFRDNDACLEWLKNNRWPDGIHCEKCQEITKHYRVTNRPAYACEFCGNHVYPMAGTILEHSATDLRKWFQAMFLMATTRCDISAKQLEREVGVTYKTAWRMFNRIKSTTDKKALNTLGEIELMRIMLVGESRNRTDSANAHLSWEGR